MFRDLGSSGELGKRWAWHRDGGPSSSQKPPGAASSVLRAVAMTAGSTQQAARHCGRRLGPKARARAGAAEAAPLAAAIRGIVAWAGPPQAAARTARRCDGRRALLLLPARPPPLQMSPSLLERPWRHRCWRDGLGHPWPMDAPGPPRPGAARREAPQQRPAAPGQLPTPAGRRLNTRRLAALAARTSVQLARSLQPQHARPVSGGRPRCRCNFTASV